jgi:hypothetical protein
LGTALRPGADPKPIGFALTGAESAHFDGDGNLVATVAGEAFKLLKPIAYQTTKSGAKTAVAAGYRIDATSAKTARIAFALGGYDRSRPLVIDPVLAYGLYLPGASASDNQSNIEGPDAPATVANANAYGGYLAKISPAGVGLLLVTPNSISFPGSSTVGFENVYYAELRNAGSKPVNLIRPFNFSSPEFSETDQCGGVLAGGAACPMTINFTPAQSGPRSAMLAIQSDGAAAPTLVPLSGTGSDQPALAASSYSLSFPTILQGAASASQTITIANYGNYAQPVAPDMSAAPDYTMVNACPAQLAPKASCKITLAFAPNQIGLLAETLTIPEPGYYY